LCQEVEILRVIVTKVTDSINGIGKSTAAELELEEGWHHFSELLEGCSDRRFPGVSRERS